MLVWNFLSHYEVATGLVCFGLGCDEVVCMRCSYIVVCMTDRLYLFNTVYLEFIKYLSLSSELICYVISQAYHTYVHTSNEENMNE